MGHVCALCCVEACDTVSHGTTGKLRSSHHNLFYYHCASRVKGTPRPRGNINVRSSAGHLARFSSAMTPSRLCKPKASTCMMRKDSATWIASTTWPTVNTHSFFMPLWCHHSLPKIAKHSEHMLFSLTCRQIEFNWNWESKLEVFCVRAGFHWNAWAGLVPSCQVMYT